MLPLERGRVVFLLLLLRLFIVSAEGNTIECYTQNGPPYNGTMNHTAAGEPCLPWSEFTHLHLRSSWNASVLQEQSNYCRNPDDDPRGPWCMVTRSKYGTCSVPHCEHLVDCYEGVGENYLGDAQTTEDGQMCATWSDRLNDHYNTRESQMVFVKFNSPTNWSSVPLFDSSVHNFRSCRNPGGKMAKPWCFVGNKAGRSSYYHSYDYNYKVASCKLDKCDESSHIGLPMDFGAECPPGFVTHVGKTVYSQGEISTVYCVLSSEELRRTKKRGFGSFCMFLLNQDRETCPKAQIANSLLVTPYILLGLAAKWNCVLQRGRCFLPPVGFDMKRTFMRTSMKVKGKYSMFRLEGQTSIWISLCCTNGSHTDVDVKYPKIGVTYNSLWNNGRGNFPLTSESETDVIHERPSSKDTPLFVSIERCPPVEGTRRRIFTMGTYKQSSLTATLLDYGYFTSMCAYYYNDPPPPPTDDEFNETQNLASGHFVALVPSILVEGKKCPPHFTPAPNAKAHLMFYFLRVAFILCKPEGTYLNDAIDRILPDGAQCFLSHTPAEIKKAEGSTDKEINSIIDGEAADMESVGTPIRRYHCPIGFDLSELRWAGGNETGLESINMHFCCRKASNETSKDSARGFGFITPNDRVEPYLDKPNIFPLPTYLRAVPTFAILIQGESCPGFMDQGALLVGDFLMQYVV
ncbi:unnamed protein product [Rodentolepis nana]|uniref:Kringle domain-containing protein n=1 Tax=Rodentolepis nana TaxID=102285 RepID=A0A0R3TQJ6_RODNA|nr:unnamed protein product [Rodentolepis nana]